MAEWANGNCTRTPQAQCRREGISALARGNLFLQLPRLLGKGRGSQVVRPRSAKPLCAGSIPARASKKFFATPRRRRGGRSIQRCVLALKRPGLSALTLTLCASSSLAHETTVCPLPFALWRSARGACADSFGHPCRDDICGERRDDDVHRASHVSRHSIGVGDSATDGVHWTE